MARKGVLRATSFTADFQQLACCWTDRLAAQALTGGSGLRPASRSARRRRGGMQGRWILTLLVCVGVSRDGRMLSAGGKLIAPRLRGPVHRRLVSSNIGGAARWVGGEVGLQLYTPAQQIVRGYGRTFWPSHAPRRWQLQRQGHSLALKRGSLSQPLALSRASHL